MAFNKVAVLGKIVLEIEMENVSPLLIGSEGELMDTEVLKDSEGQPYIPGTSIIGVLRHLLEEQGKKQEAVMVLGGPDRQSAVQVTDACPVCEDIVIAKRDGVRIDVKTGTAMDQYKFDYEIIEPGCVFRFRIIATVRETDHSTGGQEEKKWPDRDTLEKYLHLYAAMIKSGQVRLGRMTTKGFGRMQLVSARKRFLDFSRPSDLAAWLKNSYTMTGLTEEELALDVPDNEFTVDAWFDIVNSLIVRGYTGSIDEPDAVNIAYAKKDPQGNTRYVLPGTSVKGALRHRALRIINTLGGDPRKSIGEQMLKDFMGWAGEKDDEAKSGSKKKSTDDKFKSRLIVEETVINNAAAELQHRIRIDRFTGGVIEGALFDSRPLWPLAGKSGPMVNIRLTVKNAREWEKGLVMLLLKDLWTEDLAVGGEKSIGRGVLRGVRAEVKDAGKSLKIIDADGKLNLYNEHGLLEELERCVKALAEECQKGAAGQEGGRTA
ncbi:RAMP superfamily CRISPR-associated protein [Thermincola ferriacetica]